MATVSQQFTPEEADYPAADFPQLVKTLGTAFPVMGLAFDAGVDEAAFWMFRAMQYGALLSPLTIDIDWYADTATSGDVCWEAQIAAISPDADTQDVETKSLATINAVTKSHLGTVGQRLHRATITLSNLDTLAADDVVTLRVARDANNAADTMTGDAIVVLVTVSYSDT
jgi:hypothetical protein